MHINDIIMTSGDTGTYTVYWIKLKRKCWHWRKKLKALELKYCCLVH